MLIPRAFKGLNKAPSLLTLYLFALGAVPESRWGRRGHDPPIFFF